MAQPRTRKPLGVFSSILKRAAQTACAGTPPPPCVKALSQTWYLLFAFPPVWLQDFPACEHGSVIVYTFSPVWFQDLSTLWPRTRDDWIGQSVDSGITMNSVLFNRSIDLLTDQQARLLPWRVL